ncbi:MAG TPA: 23S rRNA (uracil(1939)-C(5))-methyltransferase RlmD [Chromatiales bacterium]|nr:23S rRNA (uracil(1939)-C(5))-methyltransferase RlmD [Thiotrichales bacterium]HIP67334.1 23S rRNA (uracil(1939)-C(5))-methyltransferase RlmD [Chromatiales bacterium]
MPRRRRRKPLPENTTVTIESLTHDGRGVCHIDGKAVFVDGALPGEEVEIAFTRTSRKFDEAKVENVLVASKNRVEPRCEYFGLCGGCSLQHMSPEAQVQSKQQAMLEGLEHIGKVQPENILEPITASVWGYRRKARLGVKYVVKKGRVLVGFREKRNSFLADIKRCETLYPAVGEKLEIISELIGGMDAKNTIPQIEIAVADNATALVFRHLEPLTKTDSEKLKQFGEEQQFDIWLQSAGPDSIVPISEKTEPLYYVHKDFDIKIEIAPLDFFQVNTDINHQMVKRAIKLLDIKQEDKVLDLFCGLGNFTLPMARKAKEVIGVEVDQVMVNRARQTAQKNNIQNTKYFVTDLMGGMENEPWLKDNYNKILLDPPRTGAKEVIEKIGRIGAEKIVYVSCHPGSLARDAGMLVTNYGYRLVSAGVMDMFPHTAHVESMVVFEKD